MSELEKNLYKRVTIDQPQRAAASGRAYRGFSTVDVNKEGFAKYDFDLIKQDLINHFHIRQGEKLDDPKFGTIIWDLLFEPFTIDLQEAIIDNVTEIINYDSRVSVEEIVVDTYEQGITVECTLTFIPYNISEHMRFKFDQANALG
jgi:phage baseplate assembly protein W|tara:strand:+ start:405 stop:842 length:438 start_codon:yes stop_codon:yes gene_type:complete